MSNDRIESSRLPAWTDRQTDDPPIAAVGYPGGYTRYSIIQLLNERVSDDPFTPSQSDSYGTSESRPEREIEEPMSTKRMRMVPGKAENPRSVISQINLASGCASYGGDPLLLEFPLSPYSMDICLPSVTVSSGLPVFHIFQLCLIFRISSETPVGSASTCF